MSFGVHDENLELRGQEIDTHHCFVIETSLIGSDDVCFGVESTCQNVFNFISKGCS